MLRHAETVVDRGITAGRIEPRGGAHTVRRHAGDVLDRFGRMHRIGDEPCPHLEVGEIAALAHEGLVHETFGDDDVGQRIDDRDIGARLQREVMLGTHVRGLHEIDAARIDDDKMRALAQALLQPRAEDRMRVGRIGTDHHDDVGLVGRLEILRAGRCAERGLQAVTRGRMADTGAGVDIVDPERGAHELLHEEGFLVGAAR